MHPGTKYLRPPLVSTTSEVATCVHLSIFLTVVAAVEKRSADGTDTSAQLVLIVSGCHKGCNNITANHFRRREPTEDEGRVNSCQVYRNPVLP